ncbi:succinate dehydrogenase flavoprotein subunit, partial [Rhodococcus wratislaviensis IFP 2016]
IKGRIGGVEVEGHRQFNPGWHLAVDLRNMVLVSECVAQAALLRTESRGGHTRDDHPSMEAEWRNTLLVCSVVGDMSAHPDSVVPDVTVTREPQLPMRAELLELFDIDELAKYYTDAELAEHPGRKA